VHEVSVLSAGDAWPRIWLERDGAVAQSQNETFGCIESKLLWFDPTFFEDHFANPLF